MQNILLTKIGITHITFSNMKKRLLWLDNIRNPFKEHRASVQYVCYEFLDIEPKDVENSVEITWVKTQPEFEKYIIQNGLPDFISFDNDLGIGNGEGYSCAKFVIDYCLNYNMYLPEYYVHSMNPVARDNINNLFENFKEIVQKGNE